MSSDSGLLVFSINLKAIEMLS